MIVNRCMKCMCETESYPCPHCGYGGEPQSDYALKQGTILNGKYLVGCVLGQGGFGLTYVGWDLSLDRKVAIKEYFPSGCVMRSGATSTVLIWSNNSQTAQLRSDGMESFLKEARKMAKVDEINGVIRVRDLFTANETAYIVMDFAEGETLKSLLMKNGPMNWTDAKKVFIPVMEIMDKVHQAGIIHRDLSPDNLMITPNGTVKVLDLGAAKDLTVSSGASSMVVAKGGFSPLEQYTQRGGSGPWTDVYSIAAMIFYTLTGKMPPNSVDRLEEDTLSWDIPELQTLPQNVKDALKKAMNVTVKGRCSSVRELLDAIQNEAPAPVVVPTETRKEPEPAAVPAETKPKEESPAVSAETKPKEESPAVSAETKPKAETAPVPAAAKQKAKPAADSAETKPKEESAAVPAETKTKTAPSPGSESSGKPPKKRRSIVPIVGAVACVAVLAASAAFVHFWSDWDVIKEATCKEVGEETRRCKLCSKTETKELPISDNHNWTDWVVTKEADCNTDGEETRKCELCDKTEERVLPASAAHNWAAWRITKEANCNTEGEESRKCELCGENELRVIPATGVHDWSDWTVSKKASCMEDGEETRTCSQCSETETNVLPAFGEHDWSNWWSVTKRATCGEDGEESRSCWRCHETETMVLPATGTHSWSNWSITKEATCNGEGEATRSCKQCSEKETKVLAATGVHSWTEWAVSKEASCAENGEEIRFCTQCPETETRALPATNDHAWTDWKETKKTNCGENGEEIRSCVSCGKSETRALPATGDHVWSEWSVESEGNCADPGKEIRTCEQCKQVETRELAAEHTWGGWTVEVRPTCLNDGSQIKTCAVCGDVKRLEMPRLTEHYDHKWSDWKVDGNRHSRTCTVCDEVDYTVFVGNYMQSERWYNSEDPIEWIVVQTAGEWKLLVSMNVLDLQSYSAQGSSFWKNSDVRQWLNGYFYNKAFNVQEQKNIRPVKVMNQGVFTEDSVFLLSEGEVKQYGLRNAKMSTAVKTALGPDYEAENNWWWLLRDSSDSSLDVSIVQTNGKIATEPWQNEANGGIRPAIWYKVAP